MSLLCTTGTMKVEGNSDCFGTPSVLVGVLVDRSYNLLLYYFHDFMTSTFINNTPSFLLILFFLFIILFV